MPRLATDHWKRAPTIMRIRSTPWLIVARRAARQLHPRCGPRRLAARSNIPRGCPCRSSSQPPNFSETPFSPPGYQRYSHPLHSGRRFRVPLGKSRATASTNLVSKRSWTTSRPSPISPAAKRATARRPFSSGRTPPRPQPAPSSRDLRPGSRCSTVAGGRRRPASVPR